MDPDWRIYAVLALGEIGDQRAVGTLKEIDEYKYPYKYHSVDYRTALKIALYKLTKDEQIITDSLRQLEQRSFDSLDRRCYNSAELLANVDTRNPDVIPALIKAINYPLYNIQLSAIRGLGKKGPRAEIAVPALLYKLAYPRLMLPKYGYPDPCAPSGEGDIHHYIGILEDELVESLGKIKVGTSTVISVIKNKLWYAERPRVYIEALRELGARKTIIVYYIYFYCNQILGSNIQKLSRKLLCYFNKFIPIEASSILTLIFTPVIALIFLLIKVVILSFSSVFSGLFSFLFGWLDRPNPESGYEDSDASHTERGISTILREEGLGDGYLYGSRRKGTNRPEADYDISVAGSHFVHPRSAESDPRIARAKERIEDLTGNPVDLSFDSPEGIKKKDGKRLGSSILKEGEAVEQEVAKLFVTLFGHLRLKSGRLEKGKRKITGRHKDIK